MSERFETTLKRYLRRVAPTLRPASVAGKRIAMENLIGYLREHHPKIKQWSELQRDPHIEGWLQSLMGYKPTTRIQKIRLVKLFLDDLVRWQWPQAPGPGLVSYQDVPPLPFALPKALPPDIDRAVQEALESADCVNAHALLLLRLTGMRIGELRDLSIHAMEGSEKHGFSLRVPIGKTNAERIIPLSPRAAALVNKIRAARGTRSSKKVPRRFARYLIVNERGRHPTQQSFGFILRQLTAHIQTTERIHPHRLRHTFATEMARTGMPVLALMKLLGHRTPQMTMHYVEVAHKDLRQAYDHALDQIQLIDQLHTPHLPAVSSPSAQPDTIAEVPQLFDALITPLESARRDATTPARSKQILRFIKRMRRASDDLKKIL
jgi:site-specific recombinase XerD